MTRIFKYIIGLFSNKNKSTPYISIPNVYPSQTNCSPYLIDTDIMEDIKHQTYQELKRNSRLLKSVNDDKFIAVSFGRRVPIGITAYVSHIFYWDGEFLYSSTMENQRMVRDIKIKSILQD